jgi:transcriptional regulator with XRE-family HTH domain
VCEECGDVALTFRELREARGYSYYDMEEFTALRRQTVSKVERQLVVPRIDTVFRMAAAFGLSLLAFAREVKKRTRRRLLQGKSPARPRLAAGCGG